MKTKSFIATILFFSSSVGVDLGEAFAQPPGEWTWMHGDNTPNSPGVFGTQGVASPANKPPALYEPCEWKDNNGNFWLFGGKTSMFEAAALWKYDPNPASPTYNQWTWMKGPSVINQPQPGVYGTQGVPSPANYPGARGWGASTWVDNAGNLWLFGGVGQAASGGGFLNDLWKYDPNPASSTYNQWTWMKGPNTGNVPGSYGTQGIPSINNLPPPRAETQCTWTDNAGNLWLYGGQSSNLAGGMHDDLWKYDISTNMWTWMNGSNTVDLPTIYGTQGVAASPNTPGGRWTYSSWTDLAGNLWLFGGVAGAGNYCTNDLWKYDPNPISPTYNQWTWMKGPNTGNSSGNYGTKCVSAANNVPRARWENRARVRDACGDFWNFGGLKMGGDILNDLWHYNITSNQWTWVSGDNITNQAAVYGTQGVSAPANKPGAKIGSVAWIDNNGYIWIFGGASSNAATRYNDLFRYVPDTACVPMCSSILSASISCTNALCNSQCTGTAAVTPTGGSQPYTYSWNTIPMQTTQIATGLCAGNYTLIATDASGSTATATVTITQPPTLTTVLTQTNPTCNAQCNGSAALTANGGTPAYTYSWSPSGGSASTASNLCAGNYSVLISDANGCSTAQTVNIAPSTAITSTISSTPTNCNTSTGTATANPSGGTGVYTYSWSTSPVQSSQAATGLATGVYSVTITDNIGCTGIATATVASVGGPVAVAGTTATIYPGGSTTLISSGAATYSWVPATGLSCSACTSPIASPSQTTEYCVYVFDTAGCYDSACVWVFVEGPCNNVSEPYLPNAFSPNKDNENDQWQLHYSPMECMKFFKLIVYTRWGETVFETTDPNFKWNGDWRSQPENSGVFVWYMEVEFTDGKKSTPKGNVSVIR